VVELRTSAAASKDELIHGLNQDMAAEWGRVLATLRLVTSGHPEVTESMRHALTERIKREIDHVRDLASAVVELGGEPTHLPRDYPHHDDLSLTFRLHAEIERELAERYDQRAALAETFGENHLAEKLRRMAHAKRESVAASCTEFAM